ncbi:MAG: ShlB/FhaC/HecB family hemolysin secretion/activation protein [Nitrosomonadales bacterium]|nr:ShlB/FhaC/HecB family hemolysin secretion/activation protein [Nitrosomonadales bacterium]
MKYKLSLLSLSGILFSAPSFVLAEDAVPAVPPASAASAIPAASEAEPAVLRFAIDRYVLEGASLLSQAEVDAVVAPFVGKSKDFSDVQRALEAVEEAYAKRGYSAVQVLLPEQELEKGTVHFRAVESRFGEVEVKDNRYVTEANALNALPSVRSGGVPRSRQIASELKLANENPARQLNVVLKAGEKEEEVDAKVIVTDSKPTSWGASFDNSGSAETGRTRLGLSYRNANAFDADHVANIQYLTSPQHTDRTKVLGGSYKIPLYQYGSTLEFFGGYSNVNALVGGLSNFQGGGLLFSTRYSYSLERTGSFEPRLSYGLDWRKFRKLEMTNPPPITLYNEIVVMPLSLTYTTLGKFAKSDMNINVSYSVNLPEISNGREADFAAYDKVNFTKPKPAYKVLRYGMINSQQIGGEWQFRAALNGQWSGDVLIEGEKIRLGGADAVRGFSEGSEGGEAGTRLNLEAYSPDFGKGDIRVRALMFYDVGKAKTSNDHKTTSIAGAGFGLRFNYTEQLSLRLDRAQIKNAGNDPLQTVGNWRWHAALNASF